MLFVFTDDLSCYGKSCVYCASVSFHSFSGNCSSASSGTWGPRFTEPSEPPVSMRHCLRRRQRRFVRLYSFTCVGCTPLISIDWHDWLISMKSLYYYSRLIDQSAVILQRSGVTRWIHVPYSCLSCLSRAASLLLRPTPASDNLVSIFFIVGLFSVLLILLLWESYTRYIKGLHSTQWYKTNTK